MQSKWFSSMKMRNRLSSVSLQQYVSQSDKTETMYTLTSGNTMLQIEFMSSNVIIARNLVTWLTLCTVKPKIKTQHVSSVQETTSQKTVETRVIIMSTR